jgi:tryptophan halogenase
MTIKKIVIVGGGTAGWIAANHLGKKFSHNKKVSVTLIESPVIPPIGVGEGTVPEIRRTLANFGISETDFIRECDVTFKQSIKFVNWLSKEKEESAKYFHHLFDKPCKFGDDLTPHWLSQKKNIPYAQMVSPQHNACEAFKAPKSIVTPEYDANLGYAYHLNAGKFATMLCRNAVKSFNVVHLKATVEKVILASDGSIASLLTKENGNLNFDFYVDCSGFESLLFGQALKVPFIEKSDQLMVNSALVVQVPTKETEEIPPYTIATAHQAGWIWDIALTSRRGVGFVYSNNHMSDERAKEKLDYYLKGNPNKLSYRKIPLKVGFREKFWHKNCVSLGLAQGFLEPLEATSILLTDFAAGFLAERFPESSDQMPMLEDRFNHVMDYAWHRVVDFIKLHYCISDRNDSQFWRDNKNQSSISTTLKKRLALWQKFSPEKEDFFSKFEIFDYDNYLYVLYGMNFKTQLNESQLESNDKLKEHEEYIMKVSETINMQLPNHRELLNKIKQYGLQRV